MNLRHLKGLGLLAAAALVLSAVPAHAARSTGPGGALAVDWNPGPQSPFGGTRFDGEVYPGNGYVYFLGFRTFGDATDGSVWYYDPATSSYVDTGVDMPVPVSNYQIAALNDATGLGFYIFGGRDANAQLIDTVQVFYPATNTTAVISTDPWPGKTDVGCTSLPAMGVAVLNNLAYVLGGLSFAANGCADGVSNETWIFDANASDGSRWSQGPNLNVGRGYVTPAVLTGTIYAIGGDTVAGGVPVPNAAVEAWTPPSGGWDDAGVTDLPVPCEEAQAYGFASGTPLAPGIVLAGCGQWPNAVPDTYHYSQTSNSWSYVGSFGENRRNHAGALIKRGHQLRMYILGGYSEESGFIDPSTKAEFGRGASGGGISSAGGSNGVWTRPGHMPSTS